MKDEDMSKEQNYQQLINLMKSLKCMTMTDARIDMYLNTAKKFSELAGYKEAEDLAKECKRLAKQTEDEIKKSIYESAQNKKSKAKIAADYKLAADEFRKVSGFMDADDMALQCDQLSISIVNKGSRRILAKRIGVLLCILAVIFAATTPNAKYYLANAFMVTNSYNAAIKMYNKLGDYKDSKDRISQCQYREGMELKEKGDFVNAENAFAAAKDYKDSDEQKVEMLKQIIKNGKAGDIVKLGDSKWIILDIQNTQALLLKKAASSGMAYHSDLEDITWENSTIRQYLNDEFFSQTFSENEKKNIVLSNIKNSDNEIYGTDGGNDTKDHVFLLSIEEVKKYDFLFHGFKSNGWLRSPGNKQDCAAFLAMNRSLMDYGYMVTSEEITVRPALWFNFSIN